jgi:hypothetical protein
MYCTIMKNLYKSTQEVDHVWRMQKLKLYSYQILFLNEWNDFIDMTNCSYIWTKKSSLMIGWDYGTQGITLSGAIICKLCSFIWWKHT